MKKNRLVLKKRSVMVIYSVELNKIKQCIIFIIIIYLFIIKIVYILGYFIKFNI